MAKQQVQLTRVDSIVDKLTQIHDEIAQRAYDLFRSHEGLAPAALDHWLRAELETVWRPYVELRQKGGQFELEAALAGVDPENLEVQVTPEDILISAAGEHHHRAKEGTVHVCEFSAGRLFRSVHFPDRIDPQSVKAEYRNGMLYVTAAVAKQHGKNVEIQAA